MSTAVRPGRRTGASEGDAPADVFVVFGITGDLAKVMTFRSLYRLERRGLLTARSSAWPATTGRVEELREHARKCIEDCGETIDDEVFDRFAARLSYLAGDFADRRPTSGSPQRSATPEPRSSTSRSLRSLFGMVIKGLPRPG